MRTALRTASMLKHRDAQLTYILRRSNQQCNLSPRCLELSAYCEQIHPEKEWKKKKNLEHISQTHLSHIRPPKETHQEASTFFFSPFSLCICAGVWSRRTQVRLPITISHGAPRRWGSKSASWGTLVRYSPLVSCADSDVLTSRSLLPGWRSCLSSRHRACRRESPSRSPCRHHLRCSLRSSSYTPTTHARRPCRCTWHWSHVCIVLQDLCADPQESQRLGWPPRKSKDRAREQR